ncbi:MAG: hypothetical protein JNM69_14685 [Archangium sp.]|nr:hypothetical protein [Archangium sp.]
MLTKTETLREKDLKRHFRGEAEAPDVTALKPSLPENLKSWEVTDKLTDYQLKIALNYLNMAPGTVGKNTARATTP